MRSAEAKLDSFCITVITIKYLWGITGCCIKRVSRLFYSSCFPSLRSIYVMRGHNPSEDHTGLKPSKLLAAYLTTYFQCWLHISRPKIERHRPVGIWPLEIQYGSCETAIFFYKKRKKKVILNMKVLGKSFNINHSPSILSCFSSLESINIKCFDPLHRCHLDKGHSMVCPLVLIFLSDGQLSKASQN